LDVPLKKLNLKRPIVLIGSKNIFKQQMKKLGYRYYFEEMDKNLSKKIITKKKIINIINVQFNFKKTFDKITNKSNRYINECFFTANNLLNNEKAYALINGPISKKNFLKTKYLGVTEYLAEMNNVKDFAMLIYNKRLSVSPITTHIAIKKVSSQISKKRNVLIQDTKSSVELALSNQKEIIITDKNLKTLAYVKEGVIAALISCMEELCKIELKVKKDKYFFKNSYKLSGYIRRDFLWGVD